MIKYRTVKCNVLVIGSGAAGLRTAIELSDNKIKNVIVIGKCKKGNAHTIEAAGGINAALGTMDSQDNWLIHAIDTLKEGKFLADYREVITLCRQAPSAIFELVKWGARFNREKDGSLTQRFFGAHTYRRTCFYGDQTGKEIMRVLMSQVKKRKVKFLENIFVLSLLKNKNQVNGALAIDFKNGKIIAFNSKVVVLATGGYSRIYSLSSSRQFENHGDGIKFAYDARAKLIDMEMVQFHPTGMVWPPKVEGTLVTEAVRGEEGILLNTKGERFMKRYDPVRLELSARDLVARAIYNEILEGRGTEHNAVLLDVTHLPKEKILERLPKIYQQYKEVGIDITKEKMEVAPTAHYTMGGIDVDTKGRTSIKGLYAVGEVTGQLHGANRLGGNSLAETIVFGRVVGEEVANFVKNTKIIDLKDVNEKIGELNKKFGTIKIDAEKFRREIQETMWKYIGILKNEKDLKTALRKTLEFKKKARMLKATRGIKNNVKLQTILELESMILICEAVIRSALLRKESRGAHYRTDYPEQDDKKWLVNILCKKSDKGMKLFTRRVPKIKGALLKLLKKKIEVAPHKLLE